MTATAVREAGPDASDPKGAKGKGAKGAKGKHEKKSKKKLIIIIVAVLAIAGGGYKFFLAPKPKPGPPVGGDIVSMDPTTLNLANGHYLKVGVAIQLVKGKATMADFKTAEAAEKVIDEFSNRTVASLSSNQARKALTEDLTKQIKAAYKDEVFAIFLTQFVTQ